jgi:predicted membrane protein
MTAQFLLQVFIVSSIVCVFALQVMRKKGVLRRMRQAMSVFVPVEKSETV